MNEQLYDISQLQNDWNGNGAQAFSQQHIQFVEDLLSVLPLTPFIVPTERDSIQLEYEDNSEKFYLELEIFEDRTEIYMEKDGDEFNTMDDIFNDDPEYDEKVQKIVEDFLEKIRNENYFEEER